MMLTTCSFVIDDGICACILDQLNWQCASRVTKSSILNFVCNALQGTELKLNVDSYAIPNNLIKDVSCKLADQCPYLLGFTYEFTKNGGLVI